MKRIDKYEMIHVAVTVLKPIAILLILGFAYLFFFQRFEIGIPCIFYTVTGYKCPGCGMTHALSEIWNGNYAGAMEYNALSLTVLPLVCIYLLYRSIREALGKGEGFHIWEYIFLSVMLIIALIYGYERNKI